jgi:uncharacterized membrane protein YhaH (DUF805 family)
MRKILEAFWEINKEFWINGLNFEGKETRKNYWLTELCHLVMLYIFFLLSMYFFALKWINNAVDFFQYGIEIYFLVCIIPKLAQQTRRLNALKLSKWILLINILFIFGWPILAIIYLLPTPMDIKTDGTPNIEKSIETNVTTKKKNKKKKEQ